MRKIFLAEWTGGREPICLIGTHSRFTASLKRPLRVNDRGAMKLGMIRLIRKTSSAAAGMRPAFRSKAIGHCIVMYGYGDQDIQPSANWNSYMQKAAAPLTVRRFL